MGRSVLVHDALKDLQIVHCARGLVGGELEIQRTSKALLRHLHCVQEMLGKILKNLRQASELDILPRGYAWRQNDQFGNRNSVNTQCVPSRQSFKQHKTSSSQKL